MKRYILPFMILLCGAALYADVIDKPAATVKLNKLEVITVKQFRQKIEAIELSTRKQLSLSDRKKLLDLLVGEILINQAAVRDRISVSPKELDARIQLAKQTGGMGLNLNRQLTDAEFRSLVQQSGLTWESYLEQLEKAILQQKYVMQKKQPFFEKLPEPSQEQIEDFYQSNKTSFVAPDMVRFKHIYIDTRVLSSKAERDSAGKRAEDIYRELRNGAAFEDLVVKYSDDQNSRYNGGDFGYLRRDDQGRKQLLGKEFFEAPFKLKEGQVSEVLQSNIGYHIIKISESIPFKLLELDDKIPPQYKNTVRDEIKAQLFNRIQGEYYQQALLDLLEDLKKKAQIKVFEDNIDW